MKRRMVCAAHAVGRVACVRLARLLLLAGALAVLPSPAGGASAVPQVGLDVPGTVFLGESFLFTASFDNTAADQTGYGPFIDIALDVTGADGPASPPLDGLTVLPSGAVTYLGAGLSYAILTLDDAANGGQGVPHPYARHATGQPVYLKTTDAWLGGRFQDGDQVLVILLPFGSFTPEQPVAQVEIQAAVSNLADVGVPLPITARGGFRYGNDPLDNPATDPSLLGAAVEAAPSPIPQMIRLTKAYLGPEDETATGPNFPRQYRIDVDVATGQTVTGLTIADALPPELQFVSLDAVTGGTLIGQSLPSLTSPGGELSVTLASVTGAAGTDASLTFTFFVPRLDAGGDPVLDAAAGDARLLDNQAYASGAWTPLDPRDAPATVTAEAAFTPPSTVTPDADPEHRLEAQSIAIQKSAAIVADVGAAGYSPGDTVEYTLVLQISDYFAFGDVVVDDSFSDGQLWDSSFTPTLAFGMHGTAAPESGFQAGHWLVTDLTDGTPNNDTPALEGGQNVLFDVSAELEARALWGMLSGMLLGGGVDRPFTGPYDNPLVDPPGPLPHGATTGTIKFRVVIQDRFREHYPSGESTVNPRDSFSNAAIVAGAVLNVSTLEPTAYSESDDTGASFAIPYGPLAKSVYAINGSTSLPAVVNVRPGDTVTYRLTYRLASGDVEDLRLHDYVPLPVLRVDDPDANGSAGPAWVFDDVIDAGAPAAGRAKYGPTETFRAIRGVVPGVSINATSGNNTISFDYGTHSHVPNDGPYWVDILFTLTVRTDPFADGLVLMNQAMSDEQNTASSRVNEETIVPFILNEPSVALHKGVVGYETTGFTLGGITFTAPDSPSAFSGGPIYRADQAAAIGTSDLTGNLVDAGDEVRLAIVLHNAGRSDAFDVQVADAVPAGYATPGSLGAMNLTVRRGDGTLLTSPADYTATLVGSALDIELADNYTAGNVGGDTASGALSRGYDSSTDTIVANGSSVVVITYDLVLAPDVPALDDVVNTAWLTNYANIEGGPDFTAEDPSDSALVNTRPASLGKALVGTEIDAAGNGNTQAVIGELVTYSVTVTVPEGVTPGVVVEDRLAPGLAFVDMLGIAESKPAATSWTGSPLPPAVGNIDGGTGNRLLFAFGDVTNSDADNTSAETITITFRAVVLNQNTLPAPPGTQAGSMLGNTAFLTYTDAPSTSASAANVTVVEPALALAKQVAPDNGGVPGAFANTLSGHDADNPVYYRIAISSPGGPPAFDLALGDVFPPKIASPTIYSATSAGTTVDGTARALTVADLSLTANTLSFAPGRNVDLAASGSITVIVRGVLDPTVNPGELLTNVATVTWTSLDGDFSTPRSSHNTSSTERSGAGGVGSDSTTLNNYAAANNASTSGRVVVAGPVLLKSVVATSEEHTIENRVLVDFTGAGFSGLSPGSDFAGGLNTWTGNVTAFPQFVRVGGTATGRGGGYLDFAGSPLDLTGHGALGIMARVGTGNGSPLRVRLRDIDGTIFRWDISTSSLPPAGGPSFGQVAISLLAPSGVDAPGVTPGLDPGAIARIDLRGNDTTAAFRMDFDRLEAIRPVVVPGEIVRYRLVAEMPEGTSPDLMLLDRLPSGLRFLNDGSSRVAFVSTSGSAITSSPSGSGAGAVPAIPPSAGIAGSGDDLSSFSLAVGSGYGVAFSDANVSASRTSNSDSYASGTDVYFKLGTVVNAESDPDGEYIVVEFNALVLNDAAATGVSNQSGSQLNNDFQFRLNGNTTNTQAGSTSVQNDFNRPTITEPQINNLAKSVVNPPADAGDTFIYWIRFSNHAAHPAQYAPQVRAATTASLPPGAAYNASGGQGGTGQFTGAPASVDDVALADGDRVLLKNQAAGAQNGVYKVVSVADGVWDRATDLDQSSEATQFYRVAVTGGTVNGGQTFWQESAAVALNTTSLLFVRVAADPAVRAATTGNIGTGFGSNQITGVALTGGSLVIDGVALAVGDRVLVKNQSAAARNGIYTVTTIGATATLTRAADYDSSAEAVRGLQAYVLSGLYNGGKTFAQATGSVNLNTTSITWNQVDPVAAYDLLLTDALPADALFQSITITTSTVTHTTTASGAFAGGSVTVPAVNTSGPVTVALASLAPEPEIASGTRGVTVEITAKVANGAEAFRELSNAARLTFTSLPGSGTAPNATGSVTPGGSGAADGERNGSGVGAPSDNTAYNYGSQLNNYSVGAVSTLSLARPTLDKAFKDGAISEDDTNVTSTSMADAAIGEQVTYDILVTLPEGTTRALDVVDVLPPGLRLDSYQLITSGAQSSRLAGDFGGTLPAPAVALPAAGPASVLFAFGDVALPADNDPDNNAFVLRVRATVLNIAANQAGTTLENNAHLRYGDPNGPARPPRVVADGDPANDPVVTVVAPELDIAKVADKAVVDAGDEITYTFTITNTGSQIAYDVAIEDAIPAAVASPQILTGPGDFAASGFVDGMARAAATNDLAAVFAAGVFTGAPATVDDVALADGDTVLVAGQSDAAENGLYVVDDAAAGTWTRLDTFDEPAEIVPGYLAHVAEGTEHGGSVFEQTATVLVVDTDPIEWQFYAEYAVPAAADFEIAGGNLRVRPAFALDVPPGASITLKVRGTIGSYAPGQVIRNDVLLRWTSTEIAGNPDERTGSDGVGGPLNDYAAASSAATAAVDASVVKSLFATDQAATSGTDVTIGEQVTYAIAVALPEGTTPDLTVTDEFPAGLQYAGHVIVTDAAASGGLLAADFGGTVPAPAVSGGGGDGADVTLVFGAISVDGDNNASNNAFLILLTARVLDVAGNAGFTPPGQTVLVNTATWDISSDTRPPAVAGPVAVTVVEPRMGIAKDAVPASADAGDLVTVTITVANSGTSDAFDVVIEDVISSDYDRSTVDTGTLGVDYPSDFAVSYAPATGLLRYTGGTLPEGQSRSFVFRAYLSAALAPGTVVDNVADVADATTLPGPVSGERHEPPVSDSAQVVVRSHSLSGFVYHDADNDGAFDPGETPIQGVEIQLTGVDHLGNAVSRTAVTQIDGSYSFPGLRPGSYILLELPPAGYLDGKERAGTPFGGTVNNFIDSDVIAGIVIPKGPSQAGVNYLFGELLPSSIAGRVFADGNNNGLFEPPLDYGIAGVPVRLTGVDDRGNPVDLTATTAPDGTYSFPDLRPGMYALTETQPAGFDDGIDTAGSAGGAAGSDVISDIPLAQGQDGAGYTFAEIGRGLIGDTVFLDADRDGVPDPGEGLSGVTVQLAADINGDGAPDVLTAVTDGSGRYQFPNLPVGLAYTVTVDTDTLPAGLTNTADPDGNSDNTASVLLVGAAPVRLDQDFGYQPIEPGLRIEKATNGQDADTAPGVYITVGSAVTWTYRVTNPGNVPLTHVSVTDDQPGVLPEYESGDDGDGRLEPGEIWIYRAAGTAVAGQYANVGSVLVRVQGTGERLEDADPSHYFGTIEALVLQKLTNNIDVSSPPGPEIEAGTLVTWTYRVSNPGNVPLANVTVTDDQGVVPAYVFGDNGNNLLDPGETWVYQATGIAVAGHYSNIGTAQADSPTGTRLTAVDPSYYTGTRYDLGDAPDPSYPTLVASGGARHRIVPDLRLGADADAELDGQSSADADGDDLGGSDDEDGVDPAQLVLVQGSVPSITVQVHNTSGRPATVTGWIDYDRNGVWEPDEKATGVAASGATSVRLRFPRVPVGEEASCLAGQALYVLDAGIRLLRYDLATGAVSVCATGFAGAFDLAADEMGNIYVADYGAATLYMVPAGCGPKTVVTRWTRGGPPTPWAITYNNGYLYLSDRVMGRILEIDPATGAIATYINGVVDPVAIGFDLAGNAYVATHNGAYLAKYGPGGVLINGRWVDPRLGYVDISDVIVDASAPYETYARFRISTDAGSVAEPTGNAPDGEVEDYVVTIEPDRLVVFFSGNDANIVYVCTAAGQCSELADFWVNGLQNPYGLALDCTRRLFVANSGRASIVVVDPETGQSALWDDFRGGLLPAAGPYGLLIVNEP